MLSIKELMVEWSRSDKIHKTLLDFEWLYIKQDLSLYIASNNKILIHLFSIPFKKQSYFLILDFSSICVYSREIKYVNAVASMLTSRALSLQSFSVSARLAKKAIIWPPCPLTLHL